MKYTSGLPFYHFLTPHEMLTIKLCSHNDNLFNKKSSVEDFPRIKIVDSKETETDMNDPDDELILIKENLETKRFSTEDTNKALDFIENIIHLKRKK